MESKAPLLVNGKPFEGNIICDPSAMVAVNDYDPGMKDGECEMLRILAAREVFIGKNNCSIELYCVERIRIEENHGSIHIYGKNHNITIVYNSEQMYYNGSDSSIEIQNQCCELDIFGTNLDIKFTSSNDCLRTALHVLKSNIEFHELNEVSIYAEDSSITIFPKALEKLEKEEGNSYQPISLGGANNKIYQCKYKMEQVDEKFLCLEKKPQKDA